MMRIKILVAAKHIEKVRLGYFVPDDNIGDVTRMRYGVIGFGESLESECVINHPEYDSSYVIELPVIDSEWVPQLELSVKVEGKETYLKYIYLDNVDWSKSPAFTIVVTKDRERTHVVL